MHQGTKNFEKARTSEAQRRRRLNQIKHEEDVAEKLRTDGWEIFSPTVVCDRVGIKNGKVFFLEFKKPGQTLRAGQQKVCDLMKDNYKVIYNS